MSCAVKLAWPPHAARGLPVVVLAGTVAALLLYQEEVAAASGRLLAAGGSPGRAPAPAPAPCARAASGGTRGAARGVTAVTLAYGVPHDAARVAHNCRMVAGTAHRLVVHTDDVQAAFCALCECRAFEPVGCAPPDGAAGAVNHCEKLAFVARSVPAEGELLFLDSDLLIMKPWFLDRLAKRAAAHDFLAAYDHSGYREPPRHETFFNSGLFFMRYVPAANYSDLLPRMYRYKTGFDQSITTGFVFDYYDNWDSLSWRWHCRAVLRERQDIPLDECYTIHDRSEEEELLARLNYTLLTVP